MEIFSALLALCVGNSPAIGEFLSQRPVTRSFDVFFDLCLSKSLSKQSRRRWFEAPLRLLWCYPTGHQSSDNTGPTKAMPPPPPSNSAQIQQMQEILGN